MAKYRLQREYHAPGNSSNAHKPRHFKSAEEIDGKRHQPGKNGSPMPMIVTEDGYLIPEMFAVLLDPEPEIIAEEVVMEPALEEAPTISADGDSAEEMPVVENSSEPEDMQEITDQFHKELDEIKNTDIIQKAIVKSKNSVNGTLIGAGIGAAVGLIWRKNVMITAVIGGIIGGLVGNAWATDFRKAKEKYVPKAS